ncbi:hypothetical protein FBG13_09145 [Cobetia marina]|nr:hypothetical protein FBG13_09145 [Cobetia marina]
MDHGRQCAASLVHCQRHALSSRRGNVSGRRKKVAPSVA